MEIFYLFILIIAAVFAAVTPILLGILLAYSIYGVFKVFWDE